MQDDNPFAELEALFRARRDEAERHAAACTAAECAMCGRGGCHRCGNIVIGRTYCDECAPEQALDDAMRTTLRSIPERYAWTFASDGNVVARGRIGVPAAPLRSALGAPPVKSAVLVGAYGCGKTSLACAWLYRFVRADTRRRRGSLFVDCRLMARERARNRLGDEPEAVETAMRVPLVVLDDLGAEQNDRDSVLSDIVSARYNACLPTWVTTGLTSDPAQLLEVLTARYDGGFARRVHDGATVIPLRVEAST